MDMNPPSLKEELEEAFEERWGHHKLYDLDLKYQRLQEIALWAARWAMERCADETDKDESSVLERQDGQDLVRLRVRDRIRKMAEELK